MCERVSEQGVEREVSKRKKAYKAPRRRLEPFYGFWWKGKKGEIRGERGESPPTGQGSPP